MIYVFKRGGVLFMLSCLVLQLAAVLEGAAASFGDFNATAAAVAVGESVVARVEGGAFGNPAVLTLGDSRWRVKMAGVRAFQTDYSQAEFVWRSNNWGPVWAGGVPILAVWNTSM